MQVSTLQDFGDGVSVSYVFKSKQYMQSKEWIEQFILLQC